jgi:1-acyl-sn-glycerol-3-phosphate acyltransferase
MPSGDAPAERGAAPQAGGELGAGAAEEEEAIADTRSPSSGEPSAPVLLIYNLIYWPYLLLSCAVLFFPALLLWLVTLPFDRRQRALTWYTTLWGAHYLAWAPLAGVTVEGRERAPQDAPCVYVSNHQSMVDILAVFATRLSFKWVSKVENFYAPFLGWNMALNGYVPLKRGHLPSIMRMVRRCDALLRAGESLFVFPEGTRSDDGQLRTFFGGAFRIAARNRVPIVPVLLEGTREILPKGRFRIVPRHVRVRILDPIDPASVDYDHKRLHDVVRARMLEEQARMRAAPPGAAPPRAA